MKNKEAVVEQNSVLGFLRNVQSRCLIRSTYDYYELLLWSYAPDQLGSGPYYDVGLEMLCRFMPKFDLGAALIDDEKRSLWQGDIPVYYGNSNSRYLQTADGPRYGPVFQRTSFVQMKDKIRNSSEAEMNWQLEMIRASFQMTFEKSPVRRGRAVRKVTLSSSDMFLKYAIKIGDTLERLAIRHPDGAHWFDLGKASTVNKEVVCPVTDPWLYAGTAGIGLFLANLALATGKKRYANLSREALDYSWNAWKWVTHKNLWEHFAVHGYAGISSLVYAFSECGRLLNDATMIKRALKVALEMPVKRLEKQKNPDVLGGTSGTLLTYLHLYDLHPDGLLLERAKQIEKYIMQCQAEGPSAGGWESPLSERPLLGMGHGAAGIAYALLRLYSITGKDVLRKSAEAGLRYERGAFSKKYQDWPNLQSTSDEPYFMAGWCCGAPGTGLARLGIVDIVKDDKEIEKEIDIAVAATKSHLGEDGHHLCCGETGRILLLLEAGKCLGRQQLCENARDAACAMIDFYETKGYLDLHAFAERLILPSLMSGISGIGLTLLALLYPDDISKVLLLA
jgi:type 2 lantibiotic biosynthesis protein LanM